MPDRQSPPRFLWTGLFILGPVVALGGVGMWQLRQDKAAALSAAREEARDHAWQIHDQWLPASWEFEVHIDGDARPLNFLAFEDPPRPESESNPAAEELNRILQNTQRSADGRIEELVALSDWAEWQRSSGGIPIIALASYHILRTAIESGASSERLAASAHALVSVSTTHPSVVSPKLITAAEP